jgi:tripartite-type tricarboxylate transporter receptor subunit TctC
MKVTGIRDASVRVRVSQALAAALLPIAILMGAAGHAEAAYPERAIRLVVPFPPGGSADALARIIGQKLAVALAQPVVVENRAGANGVIGMDAVAKSAPDGYTLLMTDRGALGINPSLYKKLPYDSTKDFAFVGVAAWAPYVLVGNAKLAANDLPQLVSLAKSRSCKLNYASFGPGSMSQMGTEALDKHFGICLTHVPYKGGGPAITAAMAGEVDVALATIGPALPYVKDGRIKALVVGSDKRSPLLPDTPTVVEAGAPMDVIPRTYFGFALPARTPPAVVARLTQEIQQVTGSREVTAWLIQNGLEGAKVDPAEMARLVASDIRFFSKLAAEIGLQAE